MERGWLDNPDNANLPETIALMKIVDTFPFMVDVALSKFDHKFAMEILHREAANIRAEQEEKRNADEFSEELNKL